MVLILIMMLFWRFDKARSKNPWSGNGRRDLCYVCFLARGTWPININKQITRMRIDKKNNGGLWKFCGAREGK